jgi:hypothetical protein
MTKLVHLNAHTVTNLVTIDWAPKKGGAEDSSPSPHNIFPEGMANVNGQFLPNNAAFIGSARCRPLEECLPCS